MKITFHSLEFQVPEVIHSHTNAEFPEEEPNGYFSLTFREPCKFNFFHQLHGKINSQKNNMGPEFVKNFKKSQDIRTEMSLIFQLIIRKSWLFHDFSKR